MNTEEFRSALTAEIEAWRTAFDPTLVAVYENGPTPDQDKIGPIWLDIEIRWYGATISTLGTSPGTRDTGALSISVYYKDSSGTKRSDQVIDGLREHMQARRFGSGILYAAQRTVPSPRLLGWYRTGILIPFALR